jgi:low affinity Fe/Cu permease
MSSTAQAHRSHQANGGHKAAGKGAARTTRGSFAQFSAVASAWLGSKWAFTAALLVVLVWSATGPIFHFSNTWQLVINTGTTIVTFLMVFLIQNTQNRDAQAINLKLDELIHAIGGASNQMMDIENLSDDELDLLHGHYQKIRAECVRRKKRQKG